MQEIDFEKDIWIDDSALDLEWVNQPALMVRYAQASARARARADQAKTRLELVKAELDLSIRKEPTKFGIEKITEAALTNVLYQQSGYQEANEEYLKARNYADLMQDVVRAISSRKEALENLVRLLGMSYFAGPKEPRDLSAEVRGQHEAKASNEKVRRARPKE